MRRDQRRSVPRLAMSATVLGSAILLASCSSAVNSDSTSGGDSGVLTFAVGLDAQPKNVLQNLSRNNAWVGNVFESLATQTDDGTVKPLLAKSWSFSDDGMSVDIVLQDGVTWHNGDDFTADDVKYTYDLLSQEDTQTNVDYAHFADIQVTSPTELTGTFDAPSEAQTLDLFVRAPIVHQGTFTPNDDGTTLVGTGPYTFASWSPGSSYTLKKFSDYWGEEPTLDEIDYIVTEDATAELNALKSGRAQMAWGLSITDAKTLTDGPDWETFDDGLTIHSLSMNTTLAPFKDQQVREAVAYAIDYDRINTQVFDGKGEQVNTFWAPDAPGMDESTTKHWSYDPTKAKSLLKSAGVTNASVKITVGPNPTLKAIYQIVANNLKDVGLDPSINSVDNSTFQAGLGKGDLGPAFLHFSAQGGLSPQTMLNSVQQLKKNNAEQFWNDTYVGLRDDFLAATSEEDQATTLRALTDYLQKEVPTIPTIQAPDVVVVKKGISGVVQDGAGHMMLGRVSTGG